MPQPLNKITLDSNISISFDPASLEREPELAALVAEAIATWSAIDHGLGMILVHLLGADAEAVLGMYSEVIDINRKRRLILGAGKAVLSDADFEILEAATLAARWQCTIRNKLAHGLWGQCDKVPDALIWTDQKHVLAQLYKRYNYDITKILRDTNSDDIEDHHFRLFRKDKIYVYNKDDFKRVIRDFNEVANILGEVRFIFDRKMHEMLAEIKSRSPNSHAMDHKTAALIRLSQLALYHEALIKVRKDEAKNAET